MSGEAVDTLIAVVLVAFWGFTLFMAWGFGWAKAIIWAVRNPEQLEEIRREGQRKRDRRMGQ